MRSVHAVWSAVEFTGNQPCPKARAKAAASACGNDIFLIGGRQASRVPTREIWRFSLKSLKWKRLSIDKLPLLEGASLSSHKNCLYCYGGRFLSSNANDSSLLVLKKSSKDVLKLSTTQPRGTKHSKKLQIPSCTHAHSAVIFDSSLYLFGGILDTIGSIDHLWKYEIATQQWTLLTAKQNTGPVARHAHSSVVWGGYMWVYGGLHNLKPCSDFWRYSFKANRWEEVRTRYNPGALHGHAACVANEQMFVFGGEREGNLSNELWSFRFDRLLWTKLSCHGVVPNACAFHCMLVINRTTTVGPNTASSVSDLLEPVAKLSSTELLFDNVNSTVKTFKIKNGAAADVVRSARTVPLFNCTSPRKRNVSEESLVSRNSGIFAVVNPAFNDATNSDEYNDDVLDLPGSVLNTANRTMQPLRHLEVVELSDFSVKNRGNWTGVTEIADNSFLRADTRRRSKSLDAVVKKKKALSGSRALLAVDLNDSEASCMLLVLGGRVEGDSQSLGTNNLVMWLCKIK